MENMPVLLISGFVGLIVGVAIMAILNAMGVSKARSHAKILVEDANAKSETMLRQAILEGRQQVSEYRLSAEKEIKELQTKIAESESKLLRREDNLGYREQAITKKEADLDKQKEQINEKLANLDKMQEDLQSKIDSQIVVLEQTAKLSQQEAHDQIMGIIEKKMEAEVSAYIHEQQEIAVEKAQENAREVIATAIQRYSQDEVISSTISVVGIPNEEMKGRIIGREGRNIKAIEQATGVEVLIDDTPDSFTISCFDPIRREVARQALEILIQDGRIQPQRIEEVVNKVKKDMEVSFRKYGEDAVFKLGIGKMPREIIRLIGRLRYRYSYGQNVLQHSIEVAYFAGMMAAELGLDQNLAKRAGLLHDIGKSIDFEQDGSHVDLGIKIAKKYGENDVVLNAIESHHGQVEPKYLISNLVAAADALSAGRPGARNETMENYINRIEELEKVASGFEGVEKSFAIQAGREVRVMVVPEKVADAKLDKLAMDIRDKIETTMTYPGQIKVVVIRETRACEVAK